MKKKVFLGLILVTLLVVGLAVSASATSYCDHVGYGRDCVHDANGDNYDRYCANCGVWTDGGPIQHQSCTFRVSQNGGVSHQLVHPLCRGTIEVYQDCIPNNLQCALTGMEPMDLMSIPTT